MKYRLLYISDSYEFDNIDNAHKKIHYLHKIIVDKLRKGTVHNFKNNSNIINFKAPFFRFVWNGFDLFNAVSAGTISINTIDNQAHISFKFFFWEYFVIALIFSTLPFTTMFPSVLSRILALLLIWIIYIISTIIAVGRFKNFVRKEIQKFEVASAAG